MKNKENYFLGLDIGTDSVGYAVTDTSSNYRLIKHHGEPMWGVTLFDEASLCDERRAFRTNRRRLGRRQTRVLLVQEIFAREIEKVDKNFYRRIKESALLREDSSEPNCLFNDFGFSDKDYHKKYPTIHHLICELMESEMPHDVRLVYLACAWLVAHRGHFLSEVSVDNVSAMFDFAPIYDDFLDYCRQYADEETYIEPWSLSKDKLTDFAAILKQHGVKTKKESFKKLLFDGKKIPKIVQNEDGSFPFSVEAILNLLADGSASLSELYQNADYSDLGTFSLGAKEEDYQAVLAQLGDDGELLRKLKALSDWAVLDDLCGGRRYISESKVDVYNQHKEDLQKLKKFVRGNYSSEIYKRVFRQVEANNYAAYSGNIKNVKGNIDAYKKCGSRQDFCAFLRKTLSLDDVKDVQEEYKEILARIQNGTFMPKQVNGDNRVLPYQLYYVEFLKILEKASKYLPFLSQTDENGYRTDEKLKAIMRFRVPYYVGPLNPSGEHAWIVRKAAGKIYPWNFDEKVDCDASEAAFIDKMTNACTYLAGEDVLPQNSLLYQKFIVLNEINNIKLCGVSIDTGLKQKIYSELFARKKRVTYRALISFLCQCGVSKSDAETLSGIDKDIKGSLSSYIAFKRMIVGGLITEQDAERIICRRTYCEDNNRFVKWLSNNYPKISEDDCRYIRSLPIKDFGRLSERLLTGIEGVDTESGEVNTVIGFMWERNVNLSELLLSDRYTFGDLIKQQNAEYYGEHPQTLNERLDEMYVSNAVKRPIIRTLEIVSEVVKATGKAPEKIFVEMARGATEEQKNKRTKTRKQTLIDLYNKVKGENVAELRRRLDSYGDQADNKLQSDKLYLYFMQLGKCMYSGRPIRIDELSSNTYNIDHIYPQSRVDDDSVLNNKVLVLSTINGEKNNTYPIAAEIRHNMASFWKGLLEKGLITEEKYNRLTRSTPFSAEEEWGFVNRQLVETRQSTKVITTLLAEKYPQTEIVFVKAKLASEFRHEYDLLKSRAINDLHHAKDAYLNVVCGQVYHSVFTKQWFLLNRESREYSVKTNELFARKRIVAGKEIWSGAQSLSAVKQTVRKNHCHLTVYSYCKHGGLFDQQPKRKGEGLIPRKAYLPAEKYGGYQKTKATFFSLVRCKFGSKSDVLILPVDLLVAERFNGDEVFAKNYLLSVAENLLGKKVDEISFPLGKRILKVNTVFEVDGFRMCLCGKSSGGRQNIFKPIMPLILPAEWETYIKKLESFNEKRKKNPNIKYDEVYEAVTKDKNIELYGMLANKLSERPFLLRPGIDPNRIVEKESEFEMLSIDKQVVILLNVVSFFSRSANKEELTGISGACVLAYRLSNWTKSYKTAYIVDMSVSGIWETKSQNLLALL